MQFSISQRGLKGFVTHELDNITAHSINALERALAYTLTQHIEQHASDNTVVSVSLSVALVHTPK